MTDKPYQLPELGFAFDALEPAYSSELLELHYCKHHQAYVDGANHARQDLAEARRDREFTHLNQLQKNLAFNLSGHLLHSIFWGNLAPDGRDQPAKELARHINQAFGGLESLRHQFCAAGAGLQGSGWAVLSWDTCGQSLLVEQWYDHQDNHGVGTIPLLVMDMWEHAFYLQYRNDKERWIQAFWGLINWEGVTARLENVQGLKHAEPSRPFH